LLRWKTATVAAPEQTLEALVRDELRGPVRQLVEQVVRELVREQLNGHAAAADATPATKVCRACELEKPADQFGKGRRVWKACRREQGRAWEERRVARRREHGTAAARSVDSEDEPARLPG
jgi:hypothetical protein